MAWMWINFVSTCIAGIEEKYGLVKILLKLLMVSLIIIFFWK